MEELIRNYERDFKRAHDIAITFDPRAVSLIEDMASDRKKSVKDICDELIKDYEYGLNLIKSNSGRDNFTISREVIEDPGKVLSRWIRESYKKK